VKENAEQISRHPQQIGVIQEAIVALVASDQRLQEKFDRTDEHVNTLIKTVERLIDRQNGKSEGRAHRLAEAWLSPSFSPTRPASR